MNCNKHIAIVLCLAAIDFISGNTLFAQTTSRLSGEVRDHRDHVLPGTRIWLTSSALIGGELTLHSDAQGRFGFSRLRPGEYRLKAELAGFKTIVVDQKVRLDQEAQVHLRMVPTSVGEEIEVVADAPIVDTKQVDIGAVYGQDYLQKSQLGIAARDYRSVLSAPAGVVGVENPRVFGSVASDNLYLIDGVNTTDPLFGTSSVGVNFDAIREISVRTGGFEAEYGQATGAIVNVITKSGGNEPGFSLDLRYRDSSFIESGAHFNPQALETQRRQISATVGGPVVRDRLWFFLAGEGVIDRSVEEGSPNIRDLRGFNYLGKLTWSASPKVEVTGKISVDPKEIANAVGDRFVRPEATAFQESNDRVAHLEYDSIVSPSLLLNLRAGWARQESKLLPTSGDLDRPGFIDAESGSLFGIFRRLSLWRLAGTSTRPK